MQKECRNCGKSYTLGVNGTVDGCDECLGIERDSAGRAWHPGEENKILLAFDGSEEMVITRKQAFGWE